VGKLMEENEAATEAYCDIESLKVPQERLR
jgi:hypothetical protein